MGEDDEIELRPVISGGRAVKCRKCGDRATLELRRHNAAFCAPDFLEFFRNQVREAIRKYRMLARDEPVLVAVSGGKDSLALWDVLLDDGYRTTGLYLDLGIFDYSRGLEGQVRGVRRRAGARSARRGGGGGGGRAHPRRAETPRGGRPARPAGSPSAT